MPKISINLSQEAFEYVEADRGAVSRSRWFSDLVMNHSLSQPGTRPVAAKEAREIRQKVQGPKPPSRAKAPPVDDVLDDPPPTELPKIGRRPDWKA